MKAIIFAAGLAGVLIMITAFMNMQNQKTMKNLQTPGNGKGFAVVELFTSEGCSSCPPADRLVEEIERDNKNKQLYILAFHVDYWDHQGWKDPFSDREFTNRQRQYANWLSLQTIYTPQIVVNGSTEFVGSNRGSLLQAISTGLDQEPAKPLTVKGRVEGTKLQVEYQAAEADKRSELVLALVQQSAKSNVKAGENSGRSLSHVQVVRRLIRVPMDSNNKKDITIDLPNDFAEKGWEVIGFVQQKKDGRITAAARFDFQPE